MLITISNDVLFSWDLIDETGRQVVEQIVEDEDQGPSKGDSMNGTDFQVVSKLKVLCKGRLIQIMRKTDLNNDTALI